MPSVSRRRIFLIVAAVATIAAGLTVHETVDSWAGAFAGDALYAVLLFVLVAVAAPRAPSAVVGGVAFALSAVVEFTQLTGVPAHLSATVPGVELVLGSTFQRSDLLAYAIGAALAAAVDAAVRRRAAGSSRGARTTPSSDAPAPRPPAGTPSR
ncbi:ribosomal maturation YjgA family protein [Leifsonia shinshuensis]|uniref:DUF2809 domain-containing protein n=1 Tax=Leifsonia shinshuensis TaxID=150026 RepID=A0A7G6Y7Z8_9MICO|nr:DUF2809 domain-containing protein [Leifsonia shinshuensis]QNE34613.1 DUF2809 domain-containing protein [Leifsonia shinshuensis]